MAKSYDIVGYQFKGEFYCWPSICSVLFSQPEYEGWQLADGVQMSVEDNLSEVALAFGIDRHDENTFDTDEFPKVIYRDTAADEAIECSHCHTALTEF